jgi:mono/diheme cytochrome c family protein
VEDDYKNAEGMAGYEEVMAMTPPPSTPDSIAKGKAIFEGEGTCVTCHGPTGHGDGDAGKSLDPPPRNFHATGDYKYGTGPHGIFRTAKYGIEGTGMAGFDGIVKDEDLWNVVHYVQSLQGT